MVFFSLTGAKMNKKIWKKILTAFLIALLFGVYIMIFRFSADDGESSSRLSMKFSENIARIYYRMFAGKGGNAVQTAAAGMEGLIRKAAHFTEYMAVGFLSCSIACLWIDSRRRCLAGVLVQLFLSAGIDELHQYFVPGRHASLRDVFLDVSGGIAGIILVFCLKGIVNRWNHIRKRESKTCF